MYTYIYIYLFLVQAVLIHLKMTVMQQNPYGQRNMGRSLVAYSNPRPSPWGQPETSEEWPIGGVLVLSHKNMYYSKPPGSGGHKFFWWEFNISVLEVDIVDSLFVPNFDGSRWISVAFDFADTTVWTNVVREPIQLDEGRRPTHYMNRHTQWGALA